MSRQYRRKTKTEKLLLITNNDRMMVHVSMNEIVKAVLFHLDFSSDVPKAFFAVDSKYGYSTLGQLNDLQFRHVFGLPPVHKPFQTVISSG